MITFNELGRYGRLGNQLFQYAAIKALSLKHGFEFKIPDQSTMYFDGQQSILKEFNISAKEYKPQEYVKITQTYNEPNWRTVDKEFFNIKDNTNIRGYFQSTWYFEEFETQIKNELTPKKIHLTNASRYLNEIKKANQGYEIVAIHIRRGNIVEDTNKVKIYNDYYRPNGGYFSYLEKAKEFFKNRKVKYLIFTGGTKIKGENNKNDIDWCKQNFLTDDYIFSDDGSPLKDFCRIMLCDHNIMSVASSYGWWAAYLNPNPSKIVISPKSPLVEEPNFFRFKYFPENFNLI